SSSARAAPLVCHSSARWRSRLEGDSGAAGTLEHLDHAGLHSGRVGSASNRLFPSSSSRLSHLGQHCKPTSKRSSSTSWGDDIRPLVTNAPASVWSSPTRHW